MNNNNSKLDYQTPIRNFIFEIGNLREYVESIEDMVANRSKLTKKLRKEVIPFVLRSNQLQGSENQKMPLKEIEKLEERFGRKVEFEELIDDNGKKRINIIWESDDERQISFQALDKSIQLRRDESKHIQATNELAFIKLITLVEWFLSQILRVHFLNHPNALDTSTKSFSLDDLKNIDSIDFAHEYMIDETISQITRGSFESWIDYLKGNTKNQKKEKSINIKKTLHLDLEITNDLIPKLIEAHQRRNLIVHNNGIVNKLYLNNIPKKLEMEVPEIDSSISILPSYLEESIQNFEFCFLIIGSEIMKKAPKTITESRINYIGEAQFENLKNKRFSIAKKYGVYIKNDSEASEDNKLYATINGWLAIKLDSGLEGIKNEVSNEDFRSKGKLYRMAKALVLDDYEVAIPLIKKLLSRDNSQNKLIIAEREKIKTLTNRLKKEKTFINKNKVDEKKAIEKVKNSQKTSEATIDEIIISRQNLSNLRAENFELHIDALRNWPLFEDFRTTHKKIFSELDKKYNNQKK